MKYIIRKNVPLPPVSKGRYSVQKNYPSSVQDDVEKGRKRRNFPFDKMELGDSFEYEKSATRHATISAKRFGDSRGMIFTRRGTAIWRVK